MNIKEKINQLKDKAARVAVKAAAVATLMTGAGAVSGCQENNTSTDDNKDKVENVKERDETGGAKTSVVFRSTHFSARGGHFYTDLLMENGDNISARDNEQFLEPGDTVTYEKDREGKPFGDRGVRADIKAVRYKGDAEVKKKVDFGKIGKIGKDITD